MNMAVKIPFKFLMLIISVVTLAACSQPRTPQEVAADFWKALQLKDIRLLYDSVSSTSVDKNKLDDMLPIKEVYLGETLVQGDVAYIATIVQLIIDEDAADPYEVSLDTVLRKEKDRWKVDYDRTVPLIMANSDFANVINNVQELGEAFQERFNAVIDEYQKVIPEVQKEFKRLEKDLGKRIPEVQKKMEEFAKELKEALDPPAERPPVQSMPNEPIEI